MAVLFLTNHSALFFSNMISGTCGGANRVSCYLKVKGTPLISSQSLVVHLGLLRGAWSRPTLGFLLVSGLQGCGRIHFCLFIYLLAIKLGIFFFFMATSGLLRSDQQSWIITGFFILKGPPKYFGCGTSEVLFSTL